MKNILIILGVAVAIAATSVCGTGICESPAANKTIQAVNLTANGDPQSVILKITGMTCAGCASHIHTALSKTDGVLSDEVKYPGDIATIKYDAAKISEKEIIAVIEKTGYKAEVIKSKDKKTTSVTGPKSCCSKG